MGGNQSAAARLLNISVRNIYAKARKYRLPNLVV